MPGNLTRATSQTTRGTLILVSAKPASRTSPGHLMGSAVLASKGLRQSPPRTSAPVSLLPVTSGPSRTPRSSPRVPPHILATELGVRPHLAACPKPRGLQGTGRGQASAEKLAACILGLQKTRAFARCVSSSTEKINVSKMMGSLMSLLKPLSRGGYVPKFQGRSPSGQWDKMAFKATVTVTLLPIHGSKRQRIPCFKT